MTLATTAMSVPAPRPHAVATVALPDALTALLPVPAIYMLYPMPAAWRGCSDARQARVSLTHCTGLIRKLLRDRSSRHFLRCRLSRSQWLLLLVQYAERRVEQIRAIALLESRLSGEGGTMFRRWCIAQWTMAPAKLGCNLADWDCRGTSMRALQEEQRVLTTQLDSLQQLLGAYLISVFAQAGLLGE